MPKHGLKDLEELNVMAKQTLASAGQLLAGACETLATASDNIAGPGSAKEKVDPILATVSQLIQTLEALASTIVTVNWRSTIEHLLKKANAETVPTEDVITYVSRHLAAQTVTLVANNQFGQLPGAFRMLLTEGTAHCVRALHGMVQAEDITRRVCDHAGIAFEQVEAGNPEALAKVREAASTMDRSMLGVMEMPAEMAELVGGLMPMVDADPNQAAA